MVGRLTAALLLLSLPGCAALLGAVGPADPAAGSDGVDQMLATGQAAVSGFIPGLATAIAVLRTVRRTRKQAQHAEQLAEEQAAKPSRAEARVTGLERRMARVEGFQEGWTRAHGARLEGGAHEAS